MSAWIWYCSDRGCLVYQTESDWELRWAPVNDHAKITTQLRNDGYRVFFI